MAQAPDSADSTRTEKLRAIRDLLSVKADLLAALQGRSGHAADAQSATQRVLGSASGRQTPSAPQSPAAPQQAAPLPPPLQLTAPPPAPAPVALATARGLAGLLRDSEESEPARFTVQMRTAASSLAGSPTRGGSASTAPSSPTVGASQRTGVTAAWATGVASENEALADALRSALAAAASARAEAEVARAEVAAYGVAVAAAESAASEARREAAALFAELHGPSRERERAELQALREGTLQLQSEVEVEKLLRARAEGDAQAARAALAAARLAPPPAPATPPVSPPVPAAPAVEAAAPPSAAAMLGQSGVLAPDWVASFTELPPGGHWALATDGGIWYSHERHGAWRQGVDGAFARAAPEAVLPPPRSAGKPR